MHRCAACLVVLLSFVLLSVGCEVSSKLEPSEPLSALDAAETAQLCRFTTDVVVGIDEACVGFTRDFDACTEAPPWDECPRSDADVSTWEACVRASIRCEADEVVCFHQACGP